MSNAWWLEAEEHLAKREDYYRNTPIRERDEDDDDTNQPDPPEQAE